jgi:hypothetical protein
MEMEATRILINSSPRSGHAWLQFILAHYKGNDSNIDLGDIGGDQFIVRANTPIMLLASFKDITQTIILRNPTQLIPSIVTKTMGGLGQTVTSGVAMPHEYNNLPSLDALIDEQFNVFRRYAIGIEENIERLKPFTFEQVTEDISFVVKELLGYDIPNSDIPELIELSKKRIRQHNKGNLAYNNAVPVDKKPDIYYEIQQKVLSAPRLAKSLELYETTRSLVLESQSK